LHHASGTDGFSAFATGKVGFYSGMTLTTWHAI
jgi:hypothetical protein